MYPEHLIANLHIFISQKEHLTPFSIITTQPYSVPLYLVYQQHFCSCKAAFACGEISTILWQIKVVLTHLNDRIQQSF